MNDFTPLGNDLFGDPIKPKGLGVVADNFIVPPFSILNARDGEWQNRKRAWMSYGIESEVGRADDLTFNMAAKSYDAENGEDSTTHGNLTSIFDPVLTELCYKWFCPEGGQILDPFAGGSVRGVIASLLGRDYWGCDLAEKQILANREQGERICDHQPEWVWGDSTDEVQEAPMSDFIFSCPPYGNLEVYSEHPSDISNMSHSEFLIAYRKIISEAIDRLKENRFACFVVGDFRDNRGYLRDFVGETITAFCDNGVKLYNHAILVTQVASLSMRITKQFEASRKIGKTHQNVLVFVKGDPKKATEAINEID